MLALMLLSAFGVIYAYVGYPALLYVLGLLRSPPETSCVSAHLTYRPIVTLIISAYNEERVIEAKILNSLGLAYPHELLEIMVVSDGSDDGTVKIVQRYQPQGVVLLHIDGRIGKSACLNRAVREARGEIIVFTDANSQFHADAVEALVSRFADDRVGFATGYTAYVKEENGTLVESVGIYSRIEKFAKQMESRLSSCVGADGAIFAIRKTLYRDLGVDDINDLVMPLGVVRSGFLGVLENRAVCSEGMSSNFNDEYRRQIRIATRTIRAVWTNIDLLNPVRYGLFAVQFFSHKVLKVLVPLLLMTTLFLSGVLAFHQRTFAIVFWLQIVFYVVGVAFDPSQYRGSVGRLIGVIRTFVLYNAAIAVGWLNFFRGKKFTVWATAR
ncbi:MAG: glycosyltransferase family 2 protein [Sterolibacteriaceae bacterium]|nr:glycosyltransferase family 2 protein [Candidatus Methylophosphatis haderslevensis]